MTEPIHVVLVDDEQLIRVALRAIIDSEPGMTVTGEATTGAEAIPTVRQLRPHIVLMDVRMPDIDGIRATEQLIRSMGAEAPRIIVVTTFENDDYIYQALRAGAAGFLLKRARADEVVQAIRLVAAGDSLLFPAAVRELAHRHHAEAHPDSPTAQLTERETAVLRLMTTGLNNAEIAEQLGLGTETVKSHVAKILSKLGARDRTQAVIAAYESGFVSPR